MDVKTRGATKGAKTPVPVDKKKLQVRFNNKYPARNLLKEL